MFASKSLASAIRLLATSLMVLAVSQARAEDSPVSKGERLYDKNCSQCHGDNLQNNSSLAFDLRRLRQDEYSRFVEIGLAWQASNAIMAGGVDP